MPTLVEQQISTAMAMVEQNNATNTKLDDLATQLADIVGWLKAVDTTTKGLAASTSLLQLQAEDTASRLSILKSTGVRRPPPGAASTTAPPTADVRVGNHQRPYGHGATLLNRGQVAGIDRSTELPPSNGMMSHARNLFDTEPERDETRTHTHRSRLGSTPKMDFPTFDGEDHQVWIHNCDLYFESYGVSEHMKVKFAALNVVGDAALWLKMVQKKRRFTSWVELCEAVVARWGINKHTYFMRQMLVLAQTNSVAEYTAKFNHLRHQILLSDPYTSEVVFMECFIAGLRPDIRSAVVLHCPEDVDTASLLASLQETELEQDKMLTTTKSQFKSNSRHSSSSSDKSKYRHTSLPPPPPRPPEQQCSGQVPAPKSLSWPSFQFVTSLRCNREPMLAATGYDEHQLMVDMLSNAMQSSFQTISSKIGTCGIPINCQQFNMLLVDVLGRIVAWEVGTTVLHKGSSMINAVDKNLKLPWDPGVHCLITTIDGQVHGSGSAQQASRRSYYMAFKQEEMVSKYLSSSVPWDFFSGASPEMNERLLKVQPTTNVHLQEGLFMVQSEVHSNNEIIASTSDTFLLVWLTDDDDFIKMDILVAWCGTTKFVCGVCCYLILVIAVITEYKLIYIFHDVLTSLQLQRMLSLATWYNVFDDYYLLSWIQMKRVVGAKGGFSGWYAVHATSENISTNTMWILCLPFMPANEIRSEHITVRLGCITGYKKQQKAWPYNDDRKTSTAPSFRFFSLWLHTQCLGGRSTNYAPYTNESILLFVECIAKRESNSYSGYLLFRHVIPVQQNQGVWFYLKGISTRHADPDYFSLTLPWDPGVQLQTVSPACKLFRPGPQEPLADSYRLWDPGDFQQQSVWELPITCFNSQRPITCKAQLQHGHNANDILLKIQVTRPSTETPFVMVCPCSAGANAIGRNSAQAVAMWCFGLFLRGGVHPVIVQLATYGDQVDRVVSWPWDPDNKQLRQAPLDKLHEPAAEVQWWWDPGGSSHRPAWGQAGFQGGGNVMTRPYMTMQRAAHGPTWADTGDADLGPKTEGYIKRKAATQGREEE